MDKAVVDILWEQMEPIVYITRDQFERGLQSWEVELVEIDGELSFIGLTRGPEFHFTSLGTGKRITLDMIWSRMNAIMSRHGYVTTRTPNDGADRQHRFNRSFGFVETARDEFFTFYRLEKSCQ
jgi:hypothetical protein